MEAVLVLLQVRRGAVDVSAIRKEVHLHNYYHQDRFRLKEPALLKKIKSSAGAHHLQYYQDRFRLEPPEYHEPKVKAQRVRLIRPQLSLNLPRKNKYED
jgi:hypothetical protein